MLSQGAAPQRPAAQNSRKLPRRTMAYMFRRHVFGIFLLVLEALDNDFCGNLWGSLLQFEVRTPRCFASSPDRDAIPKTQKTAQFLPPWQSCDPGSPPCRRPPQRLRFRVTSRYIRYVQMLKRLEHKNIQKQQKMKVVTVNSDQMNPTVNPCQRRSFGGH